MSRRPAFLLVVLVCGLAFACAPTTSAQPRLVLFLAADQFRGDFPDRFRDRLEPGGFRYLLEQGHHFRQAHFQHSATVTGAGHATLATGASPAAHGVVGNAWYDRNQAARAYCAGDASCVSLDQRERDDRGISARNVLVPTLGDVLVGHYGDACKVFSVSVKDRGAALPGGAKGQAYWYSKQNGGFTTSTHYQAQLPDWVVGFNQRSSASSYTKRVWELLRDSADYEFAAFDDRRQERGSDGWDNVFPHTLPKAGEHLYRQFPYTPFSDAMTGEFAQEILRTQKLGQDDIPDMLAISFSSMDYIGHTFGPNSLEQEDNFFRLDRTLARLFAVVDELVGLENTLITMCSDHGIDEVPEFRNQLCEWSRAGSLPEAFAGVVNSGFGYEVGDNCDAARNEPAELVEHVSRELRDRLNVDKDLGLTYWHPSLYLDEPAIKSLGLDVAAVEREAQAIVEATPGYARAYPRHELLQGKATGPLGPAVLKTFHAERSGNLVVVGEPFHYLYQSPAGAAAMHGSPYPYDTHVPILMAGWGVVPGVTERRVAPASIAPSVLRIMGLPDVPHMDSGILTEAILATDSEPTGSR